MPRKADVDALTLFDSLVYTCQYRLVIDPASSTMARVMEWKQVLRERIGLFDGAYHMPGVVLLETELPPDYERDLCDGIVRGTVGSPTFKLRFSGITHTEDRRTIHVGVVDGASIAPLRRTIADHVCANRRIKKLGVRQVERPMLPIAQALRPDQFKVAWTLLTSHVFTTEQRVSDVVLMKRELDTVSMDQHVRTFPLEAQA